MLESHNCSTDVSMEFNTSNEACRQLPDISSSCVFSVELQFVVMPSREDFQKHEEAFYKKYRTFQGVNNAFEDHVRRKITGLLQGAGLWAVVGNDEEASAPSFHDFHIYEWMRQYRQEHNDPTTRGYYSRGIWNIGPAPQVCVPADMSLPGDSWTSVAVKSPLMCFEADAIQTLGKLRDFLHDNLYIGNHSSSRLKIEVKLPGQDLTIADTTRLIALLYAASPWLDQLHPPQCQWNSPIAPGLLCTNLFGFPHAVHPTGPQVPELFDSGMAYKKTSPMLSHMFLTPGVVTPAVTHDLHKRFRKYLKVIEGASYMEQIVEELSVTVQEGAYHFGNLTHELSEKRTIGFFQAAGTLDMIQIQHWVHICLRLVEFAIDPISDFNGIMSMMGYLQPSLPTQDLNMYDTDERDFDDLDLPVTDLLQFIGCSPKTVGYYRSRESNPQSPELRHLCNPRPALSFELCTDTRAPLKYTFGVEIETLIPGGVDPHRSDDPFPGDHRAYLVRPRDGRPDVHRMRSALNLVETALSKSNHLAFSFHGRLRGTDSMEKIMHHAALEKGLTLSRNFRPVYQGWHCQLDGSLTCLHTQTLKGYTDGCEGVEIATPILTFDETGMRSLASGVGCLRQACRFLLDPTCSVHVHVGNTKDSWTLIDIKKVATLVWFCEPILFTFVDPIRSSHKYCRPISEQSAYAQYPERVSWAPGQDFIFEHHVPATLLDFGQFQSLARMWNSSSLHELERGLNCYDNGGNGGLSIANMCEADRHCPVETNYQRVSGTFEFRYHHGCMDIEALIQWVRLCQAIVRYAQSSNYEEYFMFLKDLIQERLEIRHMDPDFVSDFLGALGLSDAIPFWMERAAEMYDDIRTPSWSDAMAGYETARFIAAARESHTELVGPVTLREEAAVCALFENMSKED